jgi:membrane fusion protein, multidrug efflux system
LVRAHGTGAVSPRSIVPALLVVLTACGGGGAGDETEQTAQPKVPVGLGVIARDSLVATLVLTGRLEPHPGGAALLTAPAAGVVRAVRAQVGDPVTRGLIVAELEVPELAAEAAQKAEAAGQAGREAARQQQLLNDGITSARQAEEAAANARQASAAASAARDLLARTVVRSPLVGRVQEIMVQRGERVDAGAPLAQVVAPDTVDLAVPVPAPDLAKLRTGLPVDVVQDGDTAGVRGWLAALAPGVDTATNAGEAVIRVPNRDGRLHPGASATAHIRLGVRNDVLVAPDSALVLQGDTTVVFVVGRDSVAHARPVTRGLRAAGRTEVRGDLRPGDRVVTTGAFGLEDGMHVVPSARAGSP